MANFASIATTLEGLLNTALNLARSNQGVWEWYNGLSRIMSANRFSGTPRIWGPRATVAGSNTIESNAATLFGVLVDNSMTAEDLFFTTSDVAVAGGNDDWLGTPFFCPRNTITTYLVCNGGTFATGLFVEAELGTSVGIEAGTAVTTEPTVVVVYTE